MQERIKEYDPYEVGRWTEWLRGIPLGEKEVKNDVSQDKIRKIRIAATSLKNHGLYFITRTFEGMLIVRRVELEEWLDEPRRGKAW